MAQARHVDDARRALERARQHQIGPLQSRRVECEGSAGGELQPPAELLPGADQRGQHANRARGRPAVLRTLYAVVQADHGRRTGRVLACQALDVGCGDARQTGNMLRRVGLNVFAQGLKSVGMLGDIIPVVEPFLDDDVHQAKRQGRVRARLDGDMPVSGAGGAGAVWVDDHQPRAVAPCFFDEGPQVNVIAVDIRGPRDDVPGMAEMFRVGAQLFPVDRYQGIAARGRADRAIEPRGAEPVKEAAIHGPIAEHTHRSRVGVGQDGLRTVLLGDVPQPFRDQVQCLIPADGFEDIGLVAGGHSPFGCSGLGGAWGRAAAKENRRDPDTWRPYRRESRG